MNQHHLQFGIAPRPWLQHHLPWLALLALVMGMFREGTPDIGFDPDNLNG